MKSRVSRERTQTTSAHATICIHLLGVGRSIPRHVKPYEIYRRPCVWNNAATAGFITLPMALRGSASSTRSREGSL